MKSNKSRLAFSLIELSIVILIIGILVIGITKGSRILRESKLKSARSLTKSSPVNINADNLTFWLDTTSEKSFDVNEAVNSSSVTNWYDINPLATSGFNVTQSVGANKPTYIRSSTNGLPALNFDGTEWLERVNTTGKDLISNQLTVFVVQKYYSPAHSSSIFYWDLAPSASRVGLASVWEDNHVYFDVWSNPGDGRLDVNLSSNFSKYANKTVIITGIRRPNGSGDFRVNGTSYGANPIGTFGSFAINQAQNSTFYIARYYDISESHPQRSDINEIIMFRKALGDKEIIEIEKYLSTKWGIALKGL